VLGQHPNWGADIAAVSAYELSAFRQSLESMLALYDTIATVWLPTLGMVTRWQTGLLHGFAHRFPTDEEVLATLGS
jgi:hypothetical protein